MLRASNVRYAEVKTENVSGLIGGLNTAQDPTLIKNNELTKAKNIYLTLDGIEPRPGTITYLSATHSIPITGLFSYYKKDGTRMLLKMHNGTLYKSVSGASWTAITGTTWSTTENVEMIQINDYVLIISPVNDMAYTDGNTITTFSALTSPTGVTVTPQGTVGTTTYSYRISAFNSTGETLASTSASTTTGNATLSVTNFNRVGWTAVAGATGYIVYGRKATGFGESYLITVYTNTFDDTGLRSDGTELDPSTVIFPPDSNTTQGVRAKKAIFSQSRIHLAGDPNSPSRLSYGGVGQQVFNFSYSETGGGATDIFKNDGQEIRDIAPFQGGVVVWKDNAIYRFYFSATGVPTIDEITRSFGGISFRGSVAVENDIVFATRKDNRVAFFSLGNQENFSSGLLRTNELSVKVAPSLSDFKASKATTFSTFYYKYVFGCSITTSAGSTNDRIWCLDTRFGSWVHWDGISARKFVLYTSNAGTQSLLSTSDVDGSMRELFQSSKDDDGQPYTVEFETKQSNQGSAWIYKWYQNPIFDFKNVSRTANLTLAVYIDRLPVEASFSITQQASGGGVGAMLVGQPLIGDAPGGTTDINSEELPRELWFYGNGRSISYNFKSDTSVGNWKLLGYSTRYAQTSRNVDQSGITYSG